jgi:phospholipase C
MPLRSVHSHTLGGCLSRRFSRRDLLRGGLTAAGALAAGAALDPLASTSRAAAATRRYRWATPVVRRGPDSLPFANLPPGTDTMPEIEHIVMLMMENHSYDAYLGMLKRGDGFTLGGDGLPLNTNPTTTPGQELRSFRMPTDCQESGRPAQDWLASHTQYDNGKNDGFVVSASGPVAMGYWDDRNVPFYYSLASTFPLADRWFCSLLGQTDPNRRFMFAGTSAGMVNDVASQLTTKPPNGTIFDRLEQHGISWREYYHTDSDPSLGVWISDPSFTSPNVVPIENFFSDAASGNLPGYCVIDPNYDYQSEENPQDVAVGEAFVGQIVDAVMRSPAWPKTLLVWTYDEHGGYYDHVPPPPAIAPDSIAPIVPEGESAYEGFQRYGFRVPAVVVSPYARRNHVSHTICDHTSILALVERKWNLPAMTYRDANAHDLTDFIDLSHPGFPEPPVLAKPATFPRACKPGSPGGPIPPPGSITTTAASSSKLGKGRNWSSRKSGVARSAGGAGR